MTSLQEMPGPSLSYALHIVPLDLCAFLALCLPNVHIPLCVGKRSLPP